MIRTGFIVLAALCLSLSSCNQKQEHTEAQVSSPEPAAQAPAVKLAELATTKDLICGMTLEEGGIADTILHDGKIYGFCASECKAEFAKNPTAYLAEPNQ